MRIQAIIAAISLLLVTFEAAAFCPVASVSASTLNRHHNLPQKTAASVMVHATPQNYEYKDDCFGFLSFVAAGATRDVVFGGVFVVLSLAAAFATAKKWLPADPKRHTIVDRRVPGAIAAVTLVLSMLVSAPQGVPMPIPEAKTVELVIGGFSFVTAFLDIRWRDRFDYPEEFRDD